MSCLRHIFIGPLTYVVLKTVPSLMDDWNVVISPEIFMLFRTSSHIFRAKNINERAIFYSLSTSGFKNEASFNERISSIRSEEKAFKSLNNSIVRNGEFLWCTETEYHSFFKSSLKVDLRSLLILLVINLQRSI